MLDKNPVLENFQIQVVPDIIYYCGKNCYCVLEVEDIGNGTSVLRAYLRESLEAEKHPEL